MSCTCNVRIKLNCNSMKTRAAAAAKANTHSLIDMGNNNRKNKQTLVPVTLLIYSSRYERYNKRFQFLTMHVTRIMNAPDGLPFHE